MNLNDLNLTINKNLNINDNSFLFFQIWRNKYLLNIILFDLKLFNNHNKIKTFKTIKQFREHNFFNYLLMVELNDIHLTLTKNNIIWPPFLTVLIFGNNVKKIDDDLLEDCAKHCGYLKKIIFNQEMTQQLSTFQVSPSVEYLELGNCKTSPITLFTQLNNLKTLYFSYLFNNQLSYLPTSLTKLSFAKGIYFSKFDQPLGNIIKTLPNLTYLNLGVEFNQEIKVNQLNNGKLKTLKLGSHFYKTLSEGVIPNTITSFTLMNTLYSLPNYIPSSVSKIKVYSIRTLNTLSITKELKYLKIHSTSENSISIPSSITSLYIERCLPSFDLSCLPDSIKEFSYRNEDYKKITIKREDFKEKKSLKF